MHSTTDVILAFMAGFGVSTVIMIILAEALLKKVRRMLAESQGHYKSAQNYHKLARQLNAETKAIIGHARAKYGPKRHPIRGDDNE